MKKSKIYFSLGIILYWMITVFFLTIFSLQSIEGFLHYARIDIEDIDHTIAVYWISPTQYIESFLFGLFFGILYLVINELSDRYHWDKYSFSKIIFVKSLLYIIGFFLTFSIIALLIHSLGFIQFDVSYIILDNPHLPRLAILLSVFVFSNIVLINFVVQTSKKIGSNNISSFLTGKYRHPTEEERIFIFIDLKSSTMLAEKLGPSNYSYLIKESFKDLNRILVKYSFEIHQYVGDEVVLTTLLNEKSALEAISLFEDFRALIKSRSPFYKDRFDIVPYFKAGIHAGIVTTTEVGTVRRDIAFHGDVVNTTSRIQELCSPLNYCLLASKNLIDRYPQISEKYVVENLGSYSLKGKADKTKVVAIKVE